MVGKELVTPVSSVWSASGRVLRPYRAAGGRRQNCLCRFTARPSVPDACQAGGTPAAKPGYARRWSSPLCAFPAGGQPPPVIFWVQGLISPVGRAPQRRLGVQQRPQAHGQAVLARAGCIRAGGVGGMPGWPGPCLGHLLSLTWQWGTVAGGSRDGRAAATAGGS